MNAVFVRPRIRLLPLFCWVGDGLAEAVKRAYLTVARR